MSQTPSSRQQQSASAAPAAASANNSNANSSGNGSTAAGILAQCYSKTFLLQIPPSVQKEAWRLAPNELRRLLALAPRTMLFAHRALSSICHPHLSTVAWRADLSTRLTALEAEEDLLAWKVRAAAKQAAYQAHLATRGNRRVSREAQAAAYHGSVVPAEASRAALGTRRFRALVDALSGDVDSQREGVALDEANAEEERQAVARERRLREEREAARRRQMEIMFSESGRAFRMGEVDDDDENDDDEATEKKKKTVIDKGGEADAEEEEHEEEDEEGEEEEEEEEEEEQHELITVSLPDKWLLLAEIHAQVRMSRAAVEIVVPASLALDSSISSAASCSVRAASSINSSSSSSVATAPLLSKMTTTARQVSADCIGDWRRSPLILSMLRNMFQRLATAPSETALRNSGASGSVASLKRALSVRFGVDPNSNIAGRKLLPGQKIAVNVNTAMLPSDFALDVTDPERQHGEGTLARRMSRVFGSDANLLNNDDKIKMNNNNSGRLDDGRRGTSPSSAPSSEPSPFEASFVSVASYIMFQQRLFATLFHATADEQVVCAALLDFVVDADYVGGGALSRMTADVGRSSASAVDPITAAQNMRKSVNSFRRLSMAAGAADKMKLDSAVVAGGASADGSSLSSLAPGNNKIKNNNNNDNSLNSVAQMKEKMRSKVLSAAMSITDNARTRVLRPALSSATASNNSGVLAAALARVSASAAADAGRSRRGNSPPGSHDDQSVFALTQGAFEDALDATFTTSVDHQLSSSLLRPQIPTAGDAGRQRAASGDGSRGSGGGASPGKWSNKQSCGASSTAHLLHVRDFSKFGVFYEKFAKFMFELCDNWAASHSVDGAAAFFGFIARAVFPTPIDTMWQRHLPVNLRNEQKEKLRRLREMEVQLLSGGGGGGAGMQLDSQLDMLEAMAAEELDAEENNENDNNNKNRKKKEAEKQKGGAAALQTATAAWKGGDKNNKSDSSSNNKKKKNANASGDDTNGGGDAALYDASLPMIVVQAPGAQDGDTANTSAKKKKKVRFRFDNDDYGSDNEEEEDDSRADVVTEAEKITASTDVKDEATSSTSTSTTATAAAAATSNDAFARATADDERRRRRSNVHATTPLPAAAPAASAASDEKKAHSAASTSEGTAVSVSAPAKNLPDESDRGDNENISNQAPAAETKIGAASNSDSVAIKTPDSDEKKAAQGSTDVIQTQATKEFEDDDPRKLLEEFRRKNREESEREEARAREEEEERKRLAAAADKAEEERFAAHRNTHNLINIFDENDPDSFVSSSTESSTTMVASADKSGRHSLPTTARAATAADNSKPLNQTDPRAAGSQKPLFSPVPPSSSRVANNLPTTAATATGGSSSVNVATTTVAQQQQQQQESRFRRRDRFCDKRSWFRGGADGGDGSAEMRDYPLQVEQPSSATSRPSKASSVILGQQRINHRNHHPLYDIISYISPSSSSSIFPSPPAGAAVAGNDIETQTQHTIWWKQSSDDDSKKAIPVREVRPFEERKLLNLGLPTPPAKRK